ncbi:hypothetical protein MPH_08501 [Macrophomina phaseolina MS6]|uniref:Uncharacterized protein n=1 Tax=Macrophomina phaseolina (strain MS6) TaxID=1126212 RepID=K2QWT7_MACPH|nr:hypothetical protein MPH_08501 [Macrophomina phaseolina MS6]
MFNGTLQPYDVENSHLDYDHDGSMAEKAHENVYQDYVLAPANKTVELPNGPIFKINSQSLELIYDLLAELYDASDEE